MTEPVIERLWTLKAVARHLGITLAKLRDVLAHSDLPFRGSRIGSHPRVHRVLTTSEVAQIAQRLVDASLALGSTYALNPKSQRALDRSRRS